MKLPAPVDMHVHLRQGLMLAAVVPYHDRLFEYVLAMPNTTPPLLTVGDAQSYAATVAKYASRLKPLVALSLTTTMTPNGVRAAKKAGIKAFKLYPRGVTTNSDEGMAWEDILWPSRVLRDVYQAMVDEDIVLCLHGESPQAFCLDREAAFINEALPAIRQAAPELRLTLEHITTEAAVKAVTRDEKMAGTITLHHLLLTLDDVIGDQLRPHHFCKPVAKRASDREALWRAITAGSWHFFLGSDSAPHARERKEAACCAAGCFTAPSLYESLAAAFRARSRTWDQLAAFTSLYPRSWYGLPAPGYEITLEEDRWFIPKLCDGIVPFQAGEDCSWRATPAA